MAHSHGFLFDINVWKPALDKYGAVTHLTVVLYDDDAHMVCGPTPRTTLFDVFEKYGYDPGIFRDCARKCLAQSDAREAVVLAPSYGLGVVGTSLVLEGAAVGAAVAGYTLVDLSQESAIERLARQARVPFHELREIARQQQPVPGRRLVVFGELLQVFGDTILRENHRTRQYENMALRLKKEMAAKDEFLAVISHELRTPLTPILGWAKLVTASDRVDDRQKAAEAIERNAQLELKLVNDLLDMSGVIYGKMPIEMSVYDLSRVLQSAIGAVNEGAVSKKIDLECVGIKEPLLGQGDAFRLAQVFGNILSNALKFTPIGGRIDVRVERRSTNAVVRIVDTGKGIAREFLPHVFDMFRQQEEGSRRHYGGLGIGLALVKRLVEAHGGEVAIASEGEGRGTQVTVTLPLIKTPQRPRIFDNET